MTEALAASPSGPPREETDRRLTELDDTHRRMAELEERLDFTDRLLRQPEATQAMVKEG
ncbi:MAG: hypothetical protein AABY91_02270 [Gemmatimonadota bacterium]